MTNGFIEFEFDLPDALLQSLIAIFDRMAPALLTGQNVSEIPDAQGVYQLLKGGQVVYIGKTDGDAGLRQRLTRHAATIRHRKNLLSSEITFKAVRVFVFTAMDLETELIRHYSSIAPVPWNKSGFGSNDPGRNRDETNLKAGHFDLLYPIDLDEIVDANFSGGMSAAAILGTLRASLPYTLRFEGAGSGRSAHTELQTTIVSSIPPAPHTVRQIIEAVLGALPAGWQATVLAGRVILYRETKNYPFGVVIGRSGKQT